MSEYLIKEETLTAIANEIRILSETNESLSPDAMATNVGEANEEIGSQAELLNQVIIALEGKTAVAQPTVELQEKTVAPSTSSQIITPDNGYDGLSKVTVNAMPTATQATPVIEVSSDGWINAYTLQEAGYVTTGMKVAEHQLTTQAAQTITPSTTNKTIPSGRYLTGTQTIKGDANLVANNIKSGVSIFGVLGTLAAGGGNTLNGISAITSGTEKIDLDSSYVMVTHNLGVVPNFIIWMIEDDTSTSTMTSAAVGGVVFNKVIGSSTIHTQVIGFNSSGAAGGITSRSSTTSSYMTTTQARMQANTSYKLISGKTYRWICGVIGDA